MDKDGDDLSNPEVPLSCLKCNKDSCRRCWCTCNKYWQSVVVFGFILGYLALGATVFYAIERPEEEDRIEAAESDVTSSFESIVSLLTTNTNATDELARNLTDEILTFSGTYIEANDILDPDNPNWEWTSSLFFASTVITTIGMFGSC